MMIIGLTGIIGSGKSTVTSILQHKGFAIIDADIVGHTLLKKEGPVRQAVLGTFRTTDRKALAQIVFNDKKLLLKLDRLMHPAMKIEIAKQIKLLNKKNIPGIVVEAAVFIDMDLMDLADSLWAVMASERNIKERLKNKYSPEELNKRLSKTSSLTRMQAVADHIINNDGTLAQLKEKVDKLLVE